MSDTKVIVYKNDYIKIRTRYNQIISINGNLGIIHGANGVGKTYLLQEISKCDNCLYYNCNDSMFYSGSMIDIAINNMLLKDGIEKFAKTANFGYILTDYNKNKKDLFVTIVNKYLNYKRIEYSDKLYIFDKKTNNPLFHLSDGEKALILLFSNAIFSRFQTICFDDIEFGLFARWQNNIINDLQKIECKRFIISTHCPQIIGDNKEIFFRGVSN